MDLDKNFKEFIELLNVHKVKYLVVGGYAVNFHGYPRYTKDIDFWIWLSPENIKQLLKALQDFGFGSMGLSEADFSKTGNIIQLGYEPYRIDLIMELEGVDFENCYEHKEQITFNNTDISFLNLEDLIEIKKLAGRPQDIADASQLERIKQKKLK